MAISNEGKKFFNKVAKVWQNFKDYTYLEGINLSSEQINIIEHEEEQLLIEGYAGTGKSLTLIYKFINVLVREQGKKVLFVTFNETLIDDTKKRLNGSQEYRENKDKHAVEVLTFHQMATNILKKIKVIDKGIYKLTKETEKKIKDDALRRIASVKAKYTQSNYDEYKKLPKEEKLYKTHNETFIRDEVAWIKAMGFIDEKKYYEKERTGRSKSIRLTRNQRKTIFKIYKGYQHDLENNKYGVALDLEDYALKIIENTHLIDDSIKYDYIFVDEVQDLDPMQIKALCMLTKKFIVLSGDAKQRIYKKCPVKYEELGLNINKKGRRKILNKNYRSTAEIVTLANSLNFYDQDKLYEKHFVKEGERPTIKITKDAKIAVSYISRIIKEIQSKNPNKTIAIIHREEVKKKYSSYKSEFRQALEMELFQSLIDIYSYNEKFDFNKKKQVFYTNAYDVKGLEFDIVFIIDFNKSYYPYREELNKLREASEEKDSTLINDDVLEFINTEKKLLYVAMTRAKEKLYLVANSCKTEASISEFIFDFNSKDYINDGFTKKKIEAFKVHYENGGNGKLFEDKKEKKKEKNNKEKTLDLTTLGLAEEESAATL